MLPRTGVGAMSRIWKRSGVVSQSASGRQDEFDETAMVAAFEKVLQNSDERIVHGATARSYGQRLCPMCFYGEFECATKRTSRTLI